MGSGPLAWLRRRDPHYQVIRRATRVTLVASGVFYACRYGLGNTIMATYALFAVIASGVLSRLPGAPAARARTLLAALPVAWVLVTAGTVLAANTWAATAGMLLVGFTVAFAGVGGPRLVGLASGLQLFYILPCFPPFAPETLTARLAGVTIGVGLLAAAEAFLWPDPVPVPYQRRLADATAAVASFVEVAADAVAGAPDARDELAGRCAEAQRAAGRLRLSQLPPTLRPASASARDRALRDAGVAVRQVLTQARRLPGDPTSPGIPSVEAARLLRPAAAVVRAAGRTALGAGPPVTLDELDAAVAGIEEFHSRPQTSPQAYGITRLRVDGIAREVAEHARTLATAARIVAGRPVAPEVTPHGLDVGHFWYVHRPAVSLWWQQFRVHLTPHSVYFQGALRVAVALAAARAVAGALNLANGFWVLLATLTLMRTSAADTRTNLRPALLGTLAGAVASGVMLVLVRRPESYAAVLPLAMVLAFGVGPLLGLAWAQAFTTVMLTMLFAQLSPAGWQLAGVRFVDVLIGAAVGVLGGLLLWPRGGGGELRRAVARYLRAGARASEEAVQVMAGTGRPRGALDAARGARLLADACFSQYQSERPDPRMSGVDWQTALIAGYELVRGAASQLHRNPPGSLAPWAGAADLTGHARRLRSAYDELAQELHAGRLTHQVAAPPPPDVLDRGDVLQGGAVEAGPGATGSTVLRLVDVELWLAMLTENITRIQTASGRPAPGQPG